MKEILNRQVNTMTSVEILELLNTNHEEPLELKEIHETIKKDFDAEIDGGIITPSLDSRGYVAFYTMPEMESKMLVAEKDLSYLRQITQHWIDKTNDKLIMKESIKCFIEHAIKSNSEVRLGDLISMNDSIEQLKLTK